jgi:hypothetical protein
MARMNDSTAEPTINPGELALAYIGLSPIIKGEMPKIGLGRLNDIGNIPKEFAKLAGKLADGELSYQPYAHEHSYKTLLARLSSPLAQREVADLVGKFHLEAGDIATSFAVAVQQALADLKAIFPVSVYKTYAGPKNIEPNADVVFQFLNRLDVVNDPLRVFPLITTGAILKSQVEIVRQVYPTLSQEIDTQIAAAVTKRRAASSLANPYQLPPRAEIGVAKWQGRKAEFRPPKPNPPAPTQDEKSQMAKLKTTGPQKEIAPSATG